MGNWTDYSVTIGALALCSALMVVWHLQQRVRKMWAQSDLWQRRAMVFVDGRLLDNVGFRGRAVRGCPPAAEQFGVPLVPGELVQVVWGDHTMDTWVVIAKAPLGMPPEADDWAWDRRVGWNNRRCELRGLDNGGRDGRASERARGVGARDERFWSDDTRLLRGGR